MTEYQKSLKKTESENKRIKLKGSEKDTKKEIYNNIVHYFEIIDQKKLNMICLNLNLKDELDLPIYENKNMLFLSVIYKNLYLFDHVLKLSKKPLGNNFKDPDLIFYMIENFYPVIYIEKFMNFFPKLVNRKHIFFSLYIKNYDFLAYVLNSPERIENIEKIVDTSGYTLLHRCVLSNDHKGVSVLRRNNYSTACVTDSRKMTSLELAINLNKNKNVIKELMLFTDIGKCISSNIIANSDDSTARKMAIKKKSYYKKVYSGSCPEYYIFDKRKGRCNPSREKRMINICQKDILTSKEKKTVNNIVRGYNIKNTKDLSSVCSEYLNKISIIKKIA
jgi:hypothetical protein